MAADLTSNEGMRITKTTVLRIGPLITLLQMLCFFTHAHILACWLVSMWIWMKLPHGIVHGSWWKWSGIFRWLVSMTLWSVVSLWHQQHTLKRAFTANAWWKMYTMAADKCIALRFQYKFDGHDSNLLPFQRVAMKNHQIISAGF